MRPAHLPSQGFPLPAPRIFASTLSDFSAAFFLSKRTCPIPFTTLQSSIHQIWHRHICPVRAFPYCTLFIYFLHTKKLLIIYLPDEKKATFSNHLSTKHTPRICPVRAFLPRPAFLLLLVYSLTKYAFQSFCHQAQLACACPARAFQRPTFFYSNTFKPPSPHATLQPFIHQTRPAFFLFRHFYIHQ